MKRPYLGWYLCVACLALAPASLRLLAWHVRWSHPVDPTMAEAGRDLFLHEWKPNDPLTPGGIRGGLQAPASLGWNKRSTDSCRWDLGTASGTCVSRPELKIHRLPSVGFGDRFRHLRL